MCDVTDSYRRLFFFVRVLASSHARSVARSVGRSVAWSLLLLLLVVRVLVLVLGPSLLACMAGGKSWVGWRCMGWGVCGDGGARMGDECAM